MMDCQFYNRNDTPLYFKVNYQPSDGTSHYKSIQAEEQKQNALVDERIAEILQAESDKVAKLQDTISNYEYESINMKNIINKYKNENENLKNVINSLKSELKATKQKSAENENYLQQQLKLLKQNYDKSLSHKNNYSQKPIEPVKNECNELNLKINDLESQLSEWKQFSYDKEIDLKDYKYLNEKQGKELIELEKRYNDLLKQQKQNNNNNKEVEEENNNEKSQIIHTEITIPSTPPSDSTITTTTNIIKAPEVKSEIIINEPISISTNENEENIITSSSTIIHKENENNNNNDNEKNELKKKIEEQELMIQELKEKISKNEMEESVIKDYENQIEILQDSISSLYNTVYQN